MREREGFTSRSQQNNDAEIKSWHEKAACNERVDLYMPNYITPGQANERQQLCDNICPVREECLDDAMKFGDIYIFRAALTPRQLENEQAKRKKKGKLPERERKKKRLS